MIDLHKTKQDLEQKKAELLARLQQVNSEIKHETEPMEKDFAEQATQCENDDVLRELAFSLKDELKLIARALERIENDEYQYCSSCGEEINEDRLAAIPHTNQCIKCASKESIY